MTNEDTVRRYCMAVANRDHATAESLRHPRWLCEWPQSGERVTTSEAMRSIAETFPDGGWRSVERRLTGSEDSFVVTPTGQVVDIAGAGDAWTAEWMSVYPDGSEWFVIDIIALKDGKVIRETSYWAQAFEAPAWRRQWVELDAPH